MKREEVDEVIARAVKGFFAVNYFYWVRHCGSSMCGMYCDAECERSLKGAKHDNRDI